MHQGYPASAQWLPIDPGGAITAATTYTCPVSLAGYKRLWLSVSTSAVSAGYATIALVGLSGTYRRLFTYFANAGAVLGIGTDVWTCPMDAPTQFDAYMNIGTGRRRSIAFDAFGGGGPFTIRGTGDHDDTANAVTGLTLTLASSGTAAVALLGMR